MSCYIRRREPPRCQERPSTKPFLAHWGSQGSRPSCLTTDPRRAPSSRRSGAGRTRQGRFITLQTRFCDATVPFRRRRAWALRTPQLAGLSVQDRTAASSSAAVAQSPLRSGRTSRALAVSLSAMEYEEGGRPGTAPPKASSGTQPDSPSHSGQTGCLVGLLGVPLSLFGLCVFTFSMVTYYVRAGEIGVAIGIAGLLLRLAEVRIPAPVWRYGLFILWAFIASFASDYRTVAFDNVVEHLKLLTVMLIVVNSLRTRGQLRFFLLFFLGCFMLFPVRGTIIGGDDVAGRAVWNYIYNNPNDLAALCLITLGIALGFTFSRESPAIVRLGSGLSAVLLLVVMLKTQSRGAFIGLVGGMGPALLWRAMKRPFRVLVVVTALALIIGPQISPSTWARLSGIVKLTDTSTAAEADPEGSAAQRLAIRDVGWTIFLANPVLGAGLGSYPYENARYAPELGMRDAHNTYLELLAEVGLPGCLLWCALIWSVLRLASRSRRSSDNELGTQQAWLECALWGYLVTAMFGDFAKLTFLYLMVGVLWRSAGLLPRAASVDAQNRPLADA